MVKIPLESVYALYEALFIKRQAHNVMCPAQDNRLAPVVLFHTTSVFNFSQKILPLCLFVCLIVCLFVYVINSMLEALN